MQIALPARLSGAAALVASTVALGYVVTTSRGPGLIAALAATIGLVALATWNRAVTVVLLLLAILNGLPFVNFQSFVAPGSFRPNDLFVFMLLGSLAAWNMRDSAGPSPRHVVLARRWAVAFIGWWLLTVVRSSFFDTVPLLQAGLFGRDFLYFGLLVPALVGVAWTRDELLLMVRILGAATLVFAVAAIMSAVGLPGLTFITHPDLIANFHGLTRVYAPMNDLVVLAFGAGIGLALLATSVKLQRIGWSLAVVMGVAFALQLTRAAYVAALLAVVATTVLWLYQRDSVSLRMRPRVFSLFLCLALLVGTFTLVGNNGSGVGAVVSRATSSLSDVQSRSANVGYRLDVAQRMERVLGGDWPVGLGFWHPSYHYVPDLPDGSIRNGDLGISNSLMTMGLIGTLLLYLPLLYTIVALQKARSNRRGRGSEGWLAYGVASWLLIVVAASATLITLFSVTGLVLVAFALTLALSLSESGRDPLAA
jgi:hypothetical protein